MALKAGTVGVNPDILDSSGRVKEIPAGEHDLSFEVDKATGKAGYKIDGGDYHPFEEAGVTLMGWVKPAELSQEGLTPVEGIEIAEGGYHIDDQKVIVDIIIKATGTVTANTPVINGMPESSVQSNASVPLYRCDSTNTLEQAENIYFNYEGIAGTYRAYYNDKAIKFSNSPGTNKYHRVYGMYPLKGA